MSERIRLSDEAIDDVLAELSQGGADCLECACGRVHFNFEFQAEAGEDDVETLRRKRQEAPGKYIEQGFPIPHLFVGGEQLVVGCPCGRARNLAKMWWIDRREIAGFFAKVSALLAADGQDAKRLVERIRLGIAHGS